MIDLRCGDCLEVMKNIPDHSVDLIVTDPPYLISTNKGGGSMHKAGKLRSLKELERDNINKGYDIEAFGNLVLKLQKNINIYIWCNKMQIPDYFKFYVDKHKCKFDIIVWNKTNPIPTYSNKYLSDTEYCLYFRKGGYCIPQSYEDAKTYYYAPINASDKRIWGHPTIKPIDITEKLIRNSSKPNDIVLDPFMGSGTTGVACKRLNRNFIGIELNEKYFQVAQDRINGELL